MRFLAIFALSLVLALSACEQDQHQTASQVPTPKEIIDLGALITADTPRQFWGSKLLTDLNFNDPNSFRVINWKFGPVSG